MLPKTWDYSHVNTQGRNLFILRDMGHRIDAIQRTLLEALEETVLRGFFSTIYCEGYYGEYIPAFPATYTQQELKSALTFEGGGWGCLELFTHGHRKSIIEGKLRVIGVDNTSMRDEEVRRMKRILELHDKNSARTLTKEEGFELDYLLGPGTYNFTDARSGSSVEMIVKDMDEQKLKTAGLVYGDAHLELMMKLFRERGIGYALYFPGITNVSAEQERVYIEQIYARQKMRSQ